MTGEKTITEIEPLNKSRYKIYMDGQLFFVLYKGEMKKYHLEAGKEISEEALHELLTKTLPQRAKLRSMNLLKSRMYTEHQLREKLRQGFYPEEIIEEAINYVKSYHYIDDRRYAKDYITYYSESRSPRRIEQDLLKKGIERELIRKAYEEEAEEGKLPDEKVLIEKLLEKKHFDKEAADYGMKQKIAAYLYRKGFSIDNIYAAL